jgi:Flp pilus assembly protein TadG
MTDAIHNGSLTIPACPERRQRISGQCGNTAGCRRQLASGAGSRTAVEAGPRFRGTGKRASAGNALVEFSFIMPLLLLVATGMVAFGVALHNDLMLANAVNAGAQLLAFSRGQTSDPCATAASAISSAAPSLSSGISLSFVINGTTYSSSSCPSGSSNMIQGATAQVTGTYPCVLGVSGQSFSHCTLSSQISELIQ